MLSRNQLKYYSSLQQKKYRYIHKSFLAEGDKIVRELLKDPGDFLKIKTLVALPEFLEECKMNRGIDKVEVNQKELDRISSLSSPNKAILEIEIPQYPWSAFELKDDFSFFLENIQDPGNLGTIIRTADWFGIPNLFLTDESVDLYNPKVIQSTMGSFARVRVHYVKPEDFFHEIRKLPPSYQSIATALDGENIFKTQFNRSGVFLFGNESRGLSKVLSEQADVKIHIPGSEVNSGAESLNLSIAVGIIGAEIIRRKTIQNES
ncbi:MAG: TrmH family RNA methyltransferase [Bacteroidota bacterium]